MQRRVHQKAALPKLGVRGCGFYRSGEKAFIITFRHARTKRRKAITLDSSDMGQAYVQALDLARRYERGTFDPWSDRLHPATLKEAVAAYLGHNPALSHYTLRERRILLEHFAQVVGEEVPVAHVAPEAVSRYVHRSDLREATQQGYYAKLGSFFAWCLRQGMTEQNPLEKVPRPARSEKLPEFIERKQFGRLTSLMRSDGSEWLALICELAVSTGFRLSELCALTWDSVDMEQGMIVLRHRGQRGQKGSFRTKSGRERAVPIYPMCARALSRLAEVHGREGFVIRGSTGGAAYPGYVSARFRHYRELAGLPAHISFHNQRDTFASWLVQSGEELYKVQNQLGHAKPTMTMKYAHLSPESLRAVGTRVFK